MTSYTEFFAVHLAIFGGLAGIFYWVSGDPNALYGTALAGAFVTIFNFVMHRP